MAEDRPGTDADQSLIATFVEDTRYALDRLRRGGPRRLARRTFSDLEDFYLSDRHRARLATAGWVRRWLLRLWWLFKCLVLRLTPARRALLALGLLNLSAIRFGGHESGDYAVQLPSFGVALILLVLALELKDKLTARDELEAGRTVQKALMPTQPPVIGGWDVWFYTQSANEVSGDLVDAMDVDGGRTALVLADVSGKGLSAALLSAKLQATIRALVLEMPPLDVLGERLNRIMYRDGVRGRFATLVFLVAEAHSGVLRVLNAGHLAPLLLGVDGAVVEMPRGAVALGMVPRAAYFEQEIELGPGDTLVVYSDGVTEAMDAERELFGDERLRDLLRDWHTATAADIGRHLVEAVARFVGSAPVHDDVSLIVARRTA